MTYQQFKNYGQHLTDVMIAFRVISLQMALRRSQNMTGMYENTPRHMFSDDIFITLYREHGGSKSLRNVRNYLTINTASWPGRLHI